MLWYLNLRPMRYSELRRLLPNVSDKVLSERLRELECSGLVRRTTSKKEPPVTVYGLSERGESLQPMSNEVCRWGAEYAGISGVRCAQPQPGNERDLDNRNFVLCDGAHGVR